MKMDSFSEGRRNSNALPSSSYLAVLIGIGIFGTV